MTHYVGLISDTHGHQAYTIEALRVLTAFEPTAILHAGDVGGPEIVKLFPTNTPCHFVQGNCDFHLQELADAVTMAGHTWWGAFGDLTLNGTHLALLHGDDLRRLAQCVDEGQFDLVVHGHTHVASNQRRGSTTVVNPGAVYRATPHTVAVVDLSTLQAEIIPVR